MPKRVFQRTKSVQPEVESLDANQPIRFYYSDAQAKPANALRAVCAGIDKPVKEILSKEDLATLKKLLQTTEDALFEAEGYKAKNVAADEDE